MNIFIYFEVSKQRYYMVER